MNASRTTRAIKGLSPCVQVPILSARQDQWLSRVAADMGSHCYLVKGGPPSRIIDTLMRVKTHGDGPRV